MDKCNWDNREDVPCVIISKTNNSSKINEIYNSAMKNGAEGGKLLGAGGGGFFLFYVPVQKQKKLLKHFKKLINVPFKFTSEGSKIIFKHSEK